MQHGRMNSELIAYLNNEQDQNNLQQVRSMLDVYRKFQNIGL